MPGAAIEEINSTTIYKDRHVEDWPKLKKWNLIVGLTLSPVTMTGSIIGKLRNPVICKSMAVNNKLAPLSAGLATIIAVHVMLFIYHICWLPNVGKDRVTRLQDNAREKRDEADAQRKADFVSDKANFVSTNFTPRKWLVEHKSRNPKQSAHTHTSQPHYTTYRRWIMR